MRLCIETGRKVDYVDATTIYGITVVNLGDYFSKTVLQYIRLFAPCAFSSK